MSFATAPYRLTRTELAYLSAREYLRSFWWFVVAVPLFGVIAVLFGEGVLKVIGMTALLWPFSIPARSILATRRASRLLTGGCRLFAFPDRLEFRGETPAANGKPYRMIVNQSEVRDVVRRKEYLLVRTYRFSFVPITVAAFESEAQAEAFREALSNKDIAGN